jgi:hypothetical protein
MILLFGHLHFNLLSNLYHHFLLSCLAIFDCVIEVSLYLIMSFYYP